MSTSRPIPPAAYKRTRCVSAPKRPPLAAISLENRHAVPAQVLHYFPPQGLRSRSLQFQSFDQAYLDRLRVGDPRTQDHFCAYFSKLIQIKLRSRLKSPETIEDIRQETFARFFVNLRDGRILRPECLGSFVNSTCNNILREHFRVGGRDTSLDDDNHPDYPANGPSPLGILATKEVEQRVREVLEQLSERDRRLLREVFLEERDKDAVCRDFGIDRDYLRVLLLRAKKSFKSSYIKNKGDSGPELASA